jgi:hypothetical protein
MSKKLTLFTFVDAFGWEIYQKHDFLKDVIVDAKPLETTFGFSSGADPSILTGRYPDEHHHWSCFNYNPKNTPFKMFKYFSFLPAIVFERARVRHWLSKIFCKWKKYTGYFELYSVPFAHLPYFDYLEKRDYFVPKGIIKTDTIFDWCVDKNIPYYCSNWRHSEEDILKENQAEIAKGNIEFCYLYLPKLDGVMHLNGTDANIVKEKIEWLEKNIIDTLEQAKETYDEVSLYVISDHGMKDVNGSIDLISQIKKTGLAYGKDYVAMYDSTMARFWFMNTTAREKIEQVLNGISGGAIVSEQELKNMHVYFEDGRFGELFYLMNPGLLITPCYMGLKSIPGMHGYHPHDKDSYAMIASNNVLPDDLFSITDIRSVMERELNRA